MNMIGSVIYDYRMGKRFNDTNRMKKSAETLGQILADEMMTVYVLYGPHYHDDTKWGLIFLNRRDAEEKKSELEYDDWSVEVCPDGDDEFDEWHFVTPYRIVEEQQNGEYIGELCLIDW